MYGIMSIPTVEGKGDKNFLVQLYHTQRRYLRHKPHVVHFICGTFIVGLILSMNFTSIVTQ